MSLRDDNLFKEFIVFSVLNFWRSTWFKYISDNAFFRNREWTLSSDSTYNLNFESTIGINYGVGKIFWWGILVFSELKNKFLKLCFVINIDNSNKTPEGKPREKSINHFFSIFLFISNTLPVHFEDTSKQSQASMSDF